MDEKQKHRNVANPEWSRAMHGKRSSSAVTPHDSRPNRERSRAAAKRAAVKRDTRGE